jgi:hypothetical protein
MKIPESLKRMSLIQPILTTVLIGLVIILVFQFFGDDTKNNNSGYQEISKAVSFEEAVAKFQSGSFEVYTRGTLVVKNDRSASSLIKSNVSGSPTPTPSVSTSSAVENPYEDLFFFVNNGQVKRLDIRTYGQNESIFYNKSNEIVNLSNTAKAYTVNPIPPESDKTASLAYQAYYNVLQSYFPLIPLIKDFQAGKFNPTLRSTNLYSGKWKHYLYTSDEVVDVIIQTEPETGLFRSFIVANSFTSTPSQIYFDFKSYDSNQAIDNIPVDFKKLDPVKSSK